VNTVHDAVRESVEAFALRDSDLWGLTMKLRTVYDRIEHSAMPAQMTAVAHKADAIAFAPDASKPDVIAHSWTLFHIISIAILLSFNLRQEV
jgi:hypothetical protein